MVKETGISSTNSQVITLSMQGHNLLKAGRLDEARAAFEKAQTLEPENPYLLTGMGDLMRSRKLFAEAAGYYRTVLDNDHKNPYALLGLGDAFRGMRRYQEAIEVWKTYLTLHKSDNIYVLTRIANAHKTLRHYPDALTFYRRAYAVNPDDRYVLLGLADLYRITGLDLLALEHYVRAIAGGVTDITILSIVGGLYLKNNNFENARIYFEKVLAQEPCNSYALHGLGNYYRLTGDHQQSVELWEKALEHDKGTPGLLARLGDAYRKLGRLDDAGHAYRKGLAQGYDKYNFAGMLKLHCLRGGVQDICDCYRELLHHEFVDTRFVAEAGAILAQSGRRDVALEFYRFARELQKESPEACQVIDECIRRMHKDT